MTNSSRKFSTVFLPLHSPPSLSSPAAGSASTAPPELPFLSVSPLVILLSVLPVCSLFFLFILFSLPSLYPPPIPPPPSPTTSSALSRLLAPLYAASASWSALSRYPPLFLCLLPLPNSPLSLFLSRLLSFSGG